MRCVAKILLSLLMALLIFGCASRKAHDPLIASEDLLRTALLSGQDIPPQDPFIGREFKPYLHGKWIGMAASYGCYRPGQAPGAIGPSKAELLEDLLLVSAHWNLIRVYNADDDTRRILEVIREQNLPLRMMLGVWLENESGRPEARASNVENIMRGINLANEFADIVIAVNVGNETQVFWSWHRMDSQDLMRYIRILRAETSVPVTTADDYNFWNKSESLALASELDFITVHAYPLWNGKNLDEAIPWLDSTISEVRKVHPTKELVLGEIGWATDYNASKLGDGQQGSLIKGEVGLDAQQRFLADLDAWVSNTGVCTFLFEVFDEPWKGGGEASPPHEIEKNWGVFYSDRTPKQSFHNYMAQKQTDK